MSTYACIHRGVVTVTVGDVSPKDIALPAPIKLGTATVHATVKESRVPDPVLDLDYRGATIRILDVNTLRMEWNGTLAVDPDTGGIESISLSYEVFDISVIGDDLKEIIHRCNRLLGFEGENKMQDLVSVDDANRMVSWRVRIFDTQAHALAATPDVPLATPLQTGELSRCYVSQDFSTDGKNNRTLLESNTAPADIAVTPGIG
jgi:hypothetical protein